MTDYFTRIGVLASGGGSNFQAVLDEIDAGRIHGQVALVISDQPGAYVLERARHAGIATAVIAYREYPSRAAFSQALANGCRPKGSGWCCSPASCACSPAK